MIFCIIRKLKRDRLLQLNFLHFCRLTSLVLYVANIINSNPNIIFLVINSLHLKVITL